jgi:MFS family permease
MGRRLLFVQWGYFLSAISKPMMAVMTQAWWVFAARTTDRLGKGIRTGARDAMLSDEATPATKARIFGFHRGMDTMGAVTGPALALAYLYFYPEDYRTLFLLAFIPGLLGIAFTFLIKEKRKEPRVSNKPTSFFAFIRYFKESPEGYRRLVIGLLFFALINSSDVFLLLKIKDSGASDVATIGSYIFYNLIYALLSYPLGILADKIGLKKVFTGGLVVFSLVYLLMASCESPYIFLIAFMLYGIYAAATEGVAKAWISNIVEKKDTATAIGTYTGFQSICTLIASSMTGLVWYSFGGTVALLVIAGASLIVTAYILFFTYASDR